VAGGGLVSVEQGRQFGWAGRRMGGVSSFGRALVWSLMVGDSYSRAAASPSRTSGGAQWWTMRARWVGLLTRRPLLRTFAHGMADAGVHCCWWH
jgi:hypothetical protein